MEASNAKIFAERIKIALKYLKEIKISQFEIEEQLNYTSLSKAKNYSRYPQQIIERYTREELFNKILDEYGLAFNAENNSVFKKDSKIKTPSSNTSLNYIMYYYAFARETVGKAIVRIINDKKVVIDYRYDEHWEGTFQVIENYTFIDVEKTGGVTPVRKLICLFSGTRKTGRPILLGTYSTIKRDGFPAAGKIVFERVDDKSLLATKIKNKADPRIAYYLMNKVWVAETFTPNTLDNLSQSYKLINRFEGNYLLFYPKSNKEIEKGELTCNNDSSLHLSIKNMTYSGVMNPVDNHTMRLELNDDAGFSEVIENRISLLMETSKSKYEPFYHCVGISNALESSCNSFICLLIEKKLFDQTKKEERENIMNWLSETNSPKFG